MDKNLPKCLITGASGFLGQALVKEAQEKFKVYATSSKTKVNEKNVLYGRCDLTSFSDTQSMIDQVKPQVVFHLAALSQPNECAENPN